MKTGDFVKAWWDSGVMGMTPILGRVIAHGPKTFTIEWESGLKNRVRNGQRGLEQITENEYQEILGQTRPLAKL